MGIHVCVQRHLAKGESWNSTVTDHPDWDFCRVYGDRAIPSWFMHDLAEVEPLPVPAGGQGDDLLQRPSSPEGFAYLRATIPEDADTHQRQRWELLLNILESNPEYGVYFSY